LTVYLGLMLLVVGTPVVMLVLLVAVAVDVVALVTTAAWPMATSCCWSSPLKPDTPSGRQRPTKSDAARPERLTLLSSPTYRGGDHVPV